MFEKTIIFTLATLWVTTWSYPIVIDSIEDELEPYVNPVPQIALVRRSIDPKQIPTQFAGRSIDDDIEVYNGYRPVQTQRARVIDDEESQRVRRSPFNPFGSINSYPGRGFSQKAGFEHGPFGAFVSQDFNRHGMSGPKTFGAGANFANPDTGSGVNFGLSKTPSFGGSAAAGASVNLYHGPEGNINAVGQHTQHYDKDWNRNGKSDSVGLQFQNKDTKVGVGATHVDPKYGKSETQYGINVEKKF